MKKDYLILDFEDAISKQLLDKDIRDGLSSVARTGKYLWVAGDENISVQRLELLEDGSYGKAVSFFLKDFIDLPSREEEADVEGMDFDGRYLWIVGSHSYKRKKMKEGKDDPEKEMEKLAKVKLQPNRNLLARIPLVEDETGAYTLQKECPDPENPEQKLVAAKLKHSRKKWSQLTKELQKDKHLGPFIGIPGKDNGLDIEGLAAYQNKLFLGLRGPVLRGWAIILEIRLKMGKDGLLSLKKDKESGKRLKKHFLNLHGLGIRELAIHGDDILVLAGPSMDLDTAMEVCRWKNGTRHEKEQLVARQELESLLVLPADKKRGTNKAEGLVVLEKNALLITYDSPGSGRTEGDFKVKADVFYPEEREKG